MRSALGMVSLLGALVIGYLIYTTQIEHMTNGRTPIQQINLIAIRSDLLSLAQSERLYLAANGSYATLEQLRHSDIMNSFPGENRRGYIYTAEVDGTTHFRITATPADSSSTTLPTFSVDENMQVSP